LQEVEILIKLLPYFDTQLEASSKDSNELRKLLQLAKSEAEMIKRKKKVNSLLGIINLYFEKLLLPEMNDQVEMEFLSCFYNSQSKASIFVSTLNRIVWEYNFVNKLFVENYKALCSELATPPSEVLIFGGTFPFSPG